MLILIIKVRNYYSIKFKQNDQDNDEQVIKLEICLIIKLMVKLIITSLNY